MRNHIKCLLFAGILGAVALSAHADTYSNVVMSFHPVAYYPLNEVATPPAAVTASITNYGTDTSLNLTPNGDVIYGNPSPLASQPNDSSDYFNGGESYANAFFDANLSTQPPFTIEGWFLAKNINSTQCPTSDFEGNSPRSGWLIYMDIANAGQYTFRAYAQNGTSPSLSFNIGAAGSITPNQWNYLAVVVNVSGGTTNVTGYLNGVQVAGPTTLPAYVPNTGSDGGFSVGCRSDIGFNFDGDIDELAYYTNALSSATILSHYQAATNLSPVTPYDQLVLAQHPLAYFRFNEATPPLSSDYPEPLPVVHNYGSLGASGNGFFTPGSSPGAVAGPTNSGFNGLPALQLNPQFESTGTAGPGAFCAPFTPDLLNETGAITVAFWAQVPSAPQYFQTVLGRGDGSWRFDVDNPGGFPHWAASPNGDLVGATSVADNNWHFWAGVFDPVSSNATLYIDGAVVTSGTWSALDSSVQYPLLIGGAPDYDNSARNFQGNLAQVAVFTNAFTAEQINNLYAGAGGSAASAVVLNTNITVNEGDTTNMTATAGGSPTLFYQWYYTNSGGTNFPIAGGTNLTLVLSNITASEAGQYFMVASNAFGTGASALVTLNVNSGPPVFANNVAPLLSDLPAGVPDEFSVVMTGTEPFAYQWMLNSANITGATKSSYSFTVAPGTNSYSVTVTNIHGAVNSSVAQVVGLTGAPPAVGFGDGSLWHLNGLINGSSTTNIPILTNGTLVLTDGNNSEASTAFYIIPQYIGGFVASFTYTETNGSADGTTFIVQNDPTGTNALGEAGGDLGFTDINKSAAFEINLYAGAQGGSGIAFGTDGSTPDSANPLPPYLSTSPINLVSGDPINVRLAYLGNVMYAKLTDTTSNLTVNFSHSFGDLESVLGSSSGYVGFSGGTGGLAAIQAVSNFQFSYTTAPVLTLTASNNNAIIRWPVSVSSAFMLQKAAVVRGPYSSVTNTPSIVNGANQVTLPITGNSQFFRLILP